MKGILEELSVLLSPQGTSAIPKTALGLPSPTSGAGNVVYNIRHELEKTPCRFGFGDHPPLSHRMDLCPQDKGYTTPPQAPSRTTTHPDLLHQIHEPRKCGAGILHPTLTKSSLPMG